MRVDRAGSRPATLHDLLLHSEALSTTSQMDLLSPDAPSCPLWLLEDLPVSEVRKAFREFMILDQLIVLVESA